MGAYYAVNFWLGFNDFFVFFDTGMVMGTFRINL